LTSPSRVEYNQNQPGNRIQTVADVPAKDCNGFFMRFHSMKFAVVKLNLPGSTASGLRIEIAAGGYGIHQPRNRAQSNKSTLSPTLRTWALPIHLIAYGKA
jgi:hypothetical protein